MLTTWLITCLVTCFLGTGTSVGKVWFVPRGDDENDDVSIFSDMKTEWRVDELGAKSKKDVKVK